MGVLPGQRAYPVVYGHHQLWLPADRTLIAGETTVRQEQAHPRVPVAGENDTPLVPVGGPRVVAPQESKVRRIRLAVPDRLAQSGRIAIRASSKADKPGPAGKWPGTIVRGWLSRDGPCPAG